MRQKSKLFPTTADDSLIVDEATLDHDLSDEPQTVCFHCAKLIELFKLRHKTITFPTSDIKQSLDLLRFNKMSYWDDNDVELVVEIYKSGSQRQQ